MTASRIITALLTVFLVLGCENPNTPKMVRSFGGDANVRLVRGATKVEVYRVAGFREAQGMATTTPKAAGFPILAGPVLLDPAAARRLASAATDPDNYQFDMADACMFNPGYVARFSRGDEVIELAFCFHCDDVLVTHGSRYLSMMPGHDRLLALLRPLFAATDATRPSSP